MAKRLNVSGRKWSVEIVMAELYMENINQ